MNVWMKKNVSQVTKIAALSAALTLAACGGESENNDNNDNNSNNTTGSNNSNNTTGSNNSNNTTGTNNTTATNNSNNTAGTNNTTAPATANVQVLHLSNDAAAGTVDVYLGDDLLIDDLDYKEGTNFFPVPTGTTLPLRITPGDSTTEVFTFTVPDDALAADTNYTLIATGSLATGDQGTAQEFTLAILGDVDTVASTPTTLDLTIFHGALDAPAVDVVLDNDVAAPVVDGFEYKESATASVDPTAFTLGTIGLFDIYVDADYEFFAGVQSPDLSGFAGGAAIVAAIGSIAGGDFEIIAFPASVGATIEQSAGVVFGGSARLQVIHNSPDPAAASVDIYTNVVTPAVKLLSEFTFLSSSPYISVPADMELTLDVTAGGSADNSAPVLDDARVILSAGSTTVAIATVCLLYTSDQAFQLVAVAGQEGGEIADGETAALIVHGIPDAPTVGVGAGGASLIADATLSFPETSGSYLTLPTTAAAKIQLLAAGVPAFVTIDEVPLTAINQTPVVILASGTLAADTTAPGLLVVTPAGAAAETALFFGLEGAPQ